MGAKQKAQRPLERKKSASSNPTSNNHVMQQLSAMLTIQAWLGEVLAHRKSEQIFACLRFTDCVRLLRMHCCWTAKTCNALNSPIITANHSSQEHACKSLAGTRYNTNKTLLGKLLLVCKQAIQYVGYKLSRPIGLSLFQGLLEAKSLSRL